MIPRQRISLLACIHPQPRWKTETPIGPPRKSMSCPCVRASVRRPVNGRFHRRKILTKNQMAGNSLCRVCEMHWLDSFTEAESRRFDEPKKKYLPEHGVPERGIAVLERECGGYGVNLNLNNHGQVTGMGRMVCSTLTRLMRLRRCP